MNDTTEPMTTERYEELRDLLDGAANRTARELLAEVTRLRACPTEDKRGRYLDSEGIGAGAEGSQLITWGGDIDQIEVRPSPHGGKVFVALGMLGLDKYKSPETCPQVRATLTDAHARELADRIYAALNDGNGTTGGALLDEAGQPRASAVLGATDDGRLSIVCPECPWDATYPCLDLLTATAIVREHAATHVPLCECGCVPGEPCGCTVHDCECVSDCPACDAAEAAYVDQGAEATT